MFFTNVSTTVPVGGTITGTFVVHSEREIDPTAIRVDLFGQETAFVVHYPPRPRFEGSALHAGAPAGQSLEQTQRFLEASVGWETGGAASGEFYRLPFSIELPADSPPSLRTGESDFVARRLHREPSAGMFVEYTLEGRVHHPMWTDHIEYQIVHVIPAVGVLGRIANLRADDSANGVSLMINPAATDVIPGRPITGFFQVLNPRNLKFESLTIALVRRVAYSAQGIEHTLEGPRFEGVVEVPHHQSQFAGQFSIAIPVGLDTIPAMRGHLFQSEWVFGASLKGGMLSEPLEVEAAAPPPMSPATFGSPP